MFKFSLFIFCFAGLIGALDSDIALPEVVFSIFKDKTPVCIGTPVQVSTTIMTLATAAHCVLGTQASRLSVSLGNATFDYKKVLPVEKVTVHPYYTPPSADYDVALLKVTVSSSESESSVTPVIPLKTQPSAADPVSTVKWDLKSESNNITAITGSTEDRKSCKTKLGNYINVSTKMLCANVQSPVLTDGAPLLFNDKLAGLAIYSTKNNGQNLPKVFTNIANSEIYSFITIYI